MALDLANNGILIISSTCLQSLGPNGASNAAVRGGPVLAFCRNQLADRCLQLNTICRFSHNLSRQEVRLTKELGNKPGLRLPVQAPGVTNLYCLSIAKNRYAICHGKRFILIVSDINSGYAGFLADTADFRPHLKPQLGVEVGKRFVKQQYAWLDHKGPGQGDSLLLTSRELIWLSLSIFAHLNHVKSPHHLCLAIRCRNLPEDQAIGDIVSNCHVRPQGITLKDHSGISTVWRCRCDVSIIEMDRSTRRLDEAGNHSQQGGLAAP